MKLTICFLGSYTTDYGHDELETENELFLEYLNNSRGQYCGFDTIESLMPRPMMMPAVDIHDPEIE